jgi:hypothetical protein
MTASEMKAPPTTVQKWVAGVHHTRGGGYVVSTYEITVVDRAKSYLYQGARHQFEHLGEFTEYKTIFRKDSHQRQHLFDSEKLAVEALGARTIEVVEARQNQVENEVKKLKAVNRTLDTIA